MITGTHASILAAVAAFPPNGGVGGGGRCRVPCPIIPHTGDVKPGYVQLRKEEGGMRREEGGGRRKEEG